MRTKKSITVYVEYWAIEELEANKINKSQLINDLVVGYVNGDFDNTGKVNIKKVHNLEKEIKEIEKIIDKIPTLKEEIEELKSQGNQEQAEDNTDLIRLLETFFTDINEYNDPQKWLHKAKQDEKKTGLSPEQAILNRLNKFAKDNKLSLKKAKELFYQAYPGLKDLKL